MTQNKRLKIILTSAGSRSVEAIIKCLEEIREQVYLIGTNSLADFASLEELDAAYLVPETSDVYLFRERMLKIVLEEKPDLIINGRDEEVGIISTIAKENKILFFGPPPEISGIFTDKYKTFLFSKKYDLPFVATAHSNEEVEKMVERYGFPLIAKPGIGGHASKDTFVLTSEMHVAQLQNSENMIFQPFLGGKKLFEKVSKWDSDSGIPWVWNPTNTYFMIDFVLGRNGTCLSLIMTKAERNGSIVKRLEPCNDKQLSLVAQKHIETLGGVGHHGPVNIQGYIDEDLGFTAFEWNARFVGSIYGYSLLGKNLVLEALRHYFTGITNNAPKKLQEVQLFRPMVYKQVSKEHINSLQHAEYWERNSSK